MPITPENNKRVNPLILASWDNISATDTIDVAKTDAARDNKAIRDYKGNIVAYSDTEDTSKNSLGANWKNSDAPAPTAATHKAGTPSHPLQMPPEVGTTHNIPSNPDGSAYVDVSKMFIPPLTEYHLDNILPFSLLHIVHLDEHSGVISIDPLNHPAITFNIVGAAGEATHGFTVTIPAVGSLAGAHVMGSVL